MSAVLLANAVRERASTVREIDLDAHITPTDECAIRDAVELVRVLARVLEGQPLLKAFGAPGDWGYGTAIGDALLVALREPTGLAA